MTEEQAVKMAVRNGATHWVKLPGGSFYAYRPAFISQDSPHSKAMLGGGSNYAARFFARNGEFYVSEPTWRLCSLPVDARQL